MSLLFGSIVALFLSIFPIAMVVFYKSSTVITVLVVILNLLGFVTMGVTTFIAFIIAAISIGVMNTLKSIAFALVLLLIVAIAGVGDLAIIASLLGAM
ncbi:hypothetical protein Abraxas_086 [Acinetobacter phage Abraxas]|uniref:Uncharacterized protein n=2 Tax=Lazarusvirus TaxID=2842820 RepID=A0A4Y1NKL8_9CAUD|nr:hypothetical protein HYP65_gp081 [Acinetobacter phage AM101]AWY10347.1 hypothetical protein AM101_081 [Acinetobacter phage AM101]QKN88025.1 hypothetical protein Abraxas_086 [Acinetobacter phage Abraxas]UYL85855.1 hypothetical protein vBAbaPDP45_74 [Acinetobacter phage vB_AbaM_DP45]